MGSVKIVCPLNFWQQIFQIYPSLNQCLRYLSIHHALKQCICVAVKSLAAGCVGLIVWKISVLKYLVWLKHKWSKTPLSYRLAQKAALSLKPKRWRMVVMCSKLKVLPAIKHFFAVCLMWPTISSMVRLSRQPIPYVMMKMIRIWWSLPIKVRQPFLISLMLCLLNITFG